MANVTVKTYVYDPDTDDTIFVLACECLVRSATPTSFRGHPDNWTPDEGPEFEIEEITVREFGRTYYIHQDEMVALGVDLKDIEEHAFHLYETQEPDYEAMLDD